MSDGKRTEAGHLLAHRRKVQGMSLREAGRLLGITHAHVCDVEYGRRCASEKVIDKIQHHFGDLVAAAFRQERAWHLRARAWKLMDEAERLER